MPEIPSQPDAPIANDEALEVALAIDAGDVEPQAAPRPETRGAGISNRAVFTAMATLVSRGTNTFLLILLTPFLFGGLGERFYGIYQLTQRMSQFGGFASLGATSYLKIRLAEMYADQNVFERRKAIGECLLQWAALLPVLVVWTTVLYLLISGRTAVSGGDAIAVIVLIVLTPLTQLLSVGNVALFTHHLGYLGVPLWTGIGVCASAGAAAAAYAGYGIQGVAFAFAVGTLLNGVSSIVLAKKMLPWFGVEWPVWREFVANFGMSLGASLASVVYLGLNQLESLVFGLGAGPVMLARLSLTIIGFQCFDLLVRSFQGVGAYALAPMVRDRQAGPLGSLRGEAQGNIIFLFAVVGPPIIAVTPVVIPIWIKHAVLLSPWVAAAILMTSMLRLLAMFDAALLDQARDFRWKTVIAAVVVFLPSVALGFLVYLNVAPEGWYWFLPAFMATYYTLIVRRCARILSVRTALTALAIPVLGILATSLVVSSLVASHSGFFAFAAAAVGSSVLCAAASLVHPQLARSVRKLTARLWRAARTVIEKVRGRHGGRAGAAVPHE